MADSCEMSFLCRLSRHPHGQGGELAPLEAAWGRATALPYGAELAEEAQASVGEVFRMPSLGGITGTSYWNEPLGKTKDKMDRLFLS